MKLWTLQIRIVNVDGFFVKPEHQKTWLSSNTNTMISNNVFMNYQKRTREIYVYGPDMYVIASNTRSIAFLRLW